MPVRGSDDIENVGWALAEARPGLGQTLTGTGPVAVRLWPIDKSNKKSPMAGRYEGLSDRHRPICVGFDSDELPITKSSEEYSSALNYSDAPTEVCLMPQSHFRRAPGGEGVSGGHPMSRNIGHRRQIPDVSNCTWSRSH